MKVKCRKCKFEWEMDGMTFDDVAEIQAMKCAIIGNHSVVAVIE